MSKYDSAASDFRIRHHLSNIANTMIAAQQDSNKDGAAATKTSVHPPTTDKKIIRYTEFSNAVLRFGIKPADYHPESFYHIASGNGFRVSQLKPRGVIKVFQVLGAREDGELICDVDNGAQFKNLSDFVKAMESLENCPKKSLKDILPTNT